ncbi:hypothetical protein PV328_001283 [Microctonus aethiopoides]|uniref:Uncharacterized protein n=1 Tax=Microctonus aethiopoides TaxID=144406 RepID=A0AA39KXE4_9HYME|nr:hypothetical protein PV328_001283 [Microctonus aethiopoides]
MSDRVKKHQALKKYMNNRPQPPNTPSLLLSMSRIVNNHDTNNHDDDNNLNSDAIGDNFMNRESNYSAFYADYEFDENSSKSDCVDNYNQFRHPTESEVIACNNTDADNGDGNNESIAEENVVNSDIIREKPRQCGHEKIWIAFN